MQQEKSINPARPFAFIMMLVLAAAIIFAATTARAEAPEYGLEVTVDIAPELAERTRPDQTVFIFAKAMQGPPAPLAAIKARVSDLPMTVILDDSTSPAPMFKLSNYHAVSVSARVSISGEPKRSPGDLEGVRQNVHVNRHNAPFKLTIDQVVSAEAPK